MKKKYTGPIKNYVINLDRAEARWKHIQEQFSCLGLEVTRVPAVDGRALTVDDIKHYRRGCYRLLFDTEVACFLSHRRCWQLIVEGEEDMACIFEDDVYLSKKLPDFLEKRPWPDYIELLSLEQFDTILDAIEEPVFKKDGYKIYRTLGYNPGTGGYLVSKEFAKILLKESEKFYHLVDAFLFNPRRLIANKYNAYQISPALCLQGYRNVEIVQKFYVYPTMQELKTLFSSKALKEKKNLRYYITRLKQTLKYKRDFSKGGPVQIDFEK